MWKSGGVNEQVEPGSGQAALRSAQLLVSASEVCFEALSPFIERDWRSVRARDLDWSVWDTVVHVNDDLYFYAAQILLADEGDYICFELAADDHATPERLLAALAVQARLLATTVTVADPGSRAHHVRGGSDPVGFAAMGVVETLIHTYDAVHGLDGASTWRPPNDLAAPVLTRLFPHTPAGAANAPGELLLHMCGRIPLGDRPRQTDWRWYGAAPHSGPANAP
jgi:hypothetical protein